MPQYSWWSCFFLGVLGVLGVEGRAIENRRLTEFPAIGRSSVVDQDFYGAMSGFLTDHLPLRDLLVRANSLIALHVWKDSPNPNVHVGREDWLFTTAFDRTAPMGCRSTSSLSLQNSGERSTRAVAKCDW